MLENENETTALKMVFLMAIIYVIVWVGISAFTSIQNKQICQEEFGEDVQVDYSVKTREGYIACCYPIYEDNLEVDEHCEAVRK